MEYCGVSRTVQFEIAILFRVKLQQLLQKEVFVSTFGNNFVAPWRPSCNLCLKAVAIQVAEKIAPGNRALLAV